MKKLRFGLPTTISIAALALCVLGLVLVAGFKSPEEVRGYAELALLDGGCRVEGEPVNVASCEQMGRGVYAVVFTEPLSGTPPFVTRSTCCLGQTGAATDDRSDRRVLISIGRVKPKSLPAIVQVLVP